MIQITDARKPKLRSFSSLRAKEFFVFSGKIYQKTQSEFRWNCDSVANASWNCNSVANAFCISTGDPVWMDKNTKVELPNFTLTIE